MDARAIPETDEELAARISEGGDAAALHTLPYDIACLGETQTGGPLPDDLKRMIASVDVPTQLLVGGKSPPWMHHAAKAVADAVPGGTVRVLPGQEHTVAAKAVAPVLVEFFRAAGHSSSPATASPSGSHANA